MTTRKSSGWSPGVFGGGGGGGAVGEAATESYSGATTVTNGSYERDYDPDTATALSGMGSGDTAIVPVESVDLGGTTFTPPANARYELLGPLRFSNAAPVWGVTNDGLRVLGGELQLGGQLYINGATDVYIEHLTLAGGAVFVDSILCANGGRVVIGRLSTYALLYADSLVQCNGAGSVVEIMSVDRPITNADSRLFEATAGGRIIIHSGYAPDAGGTYTPIFGAYSGGSIEVRRYTGATTKKFALASGAGSRVSIVDCESAYTGTMVEAASSGSVHVDCDPEKFPLDLVLVSGGGTVTTGKSLRMETESGATGVIGPQTEYVSSERSATGTQSLDLSYLADCALGHVVSIKDADGNAGTNAITINVGTGSGDTIDGANSVSITSDYGVVRLVRGASEWSVL